jgi:hypothetical protein
LLGRHVSHRANGGARTGKILLSDSGRMSDSPMNFVPVRARLRVTLTADAFWSRNMSRTGNGKVIEEIFARSDVDYIHVNSTTAGCFTFRIERQDRPMTPE